MPTKLCAPWPGELLTQRAPQRLTYDDETHAVSSGQAGLADMYAS